ncbi:MAG: hypothetical protein LKI93_01945 [Bifidobacteriaceae bacterium]|jgi:VIT1/CCC1 family predicted Fe2+/Mn2+ transporter|nr:hypothetical protein [Bifidobacteriaceae bacterium]MCI1915473.1 hypothetical protein [Bifidobacteriaceae bacterium]
MTLNTNNPNANDSNDTTRITESGDETQPLQSTVNEDATTRIPDQYSARAEEKAEARRRKAAWKQQQRASREYTREAYRDGYPGPDYSRAGQAAPTFRSGPNVAAIVWGCITLLIGGVALLWFLMPNLFVSTNIWAIILSIAFAAIGLSLVIGAIVTSLSGIRKRNSLNQDSVTSDEASPEGL